MKQEIISEASKLLTEVYEQYKDKGMLSVFLWGSITRDDFDPTTSDVDSIAIVDKTVDLETRMEIKQWLNDNFSIDMPFNFQFYGIEELNGGEQYTLLGQYQPAGYFLLRFNEWMFIAGKQYARSDFSATNYTPKDSIGHQLGQIESALKQVTGEAPSDPRRKGLQSSCEDVVKGVLFALYWNAVDDGYTGRLIYDEIPSVTSDGFKQLAVEMLGVRKASSYTPESVLALRGEIEELVDFLKAKLAE